MPGGQSGAGKLGSVYDCRVFILPFANVGAKTKLTFRDLLDGDVMQFQNWGKSKSNNLGIRNLLLLIADSFRLFSWIQSNIW